MPAASSTLDLVRPRYLHVPPHVGTAGANVADLMSVFGLELDGAQRLAVDALCSVRSEEPFRWAALEGAVIEPRQNGKSVGILLPIAVFVALARPDQLVVWSAHRYKTSREAFLALLKLYRKSRLLKARVSRVIYSNGEEGFEFSNGSRLVFVARSQASGRGLSGDLVILDEALFLTGEMMGALFPTLSARENPMVLYASSACLAASDVLRSVVGRGRAGDDPSLTFVEWCAEQDCESPRCTHEVGVPGCACDNPQRWREANPSDRVSLDYIGNERRAIPAGEFARERMGWHEDPEVHGRVIPAPTWEACRLPGSVIPEGSRFVAAVDVSPDRSVASVAVCGGSSVEGRTHVEVVGHESGAGWVVDAVGRLGASAVVVDAAGGAAALKDALEAAGLEVVVASAGQMTQACGMFFDSVTAGSVAHLGQVQLDMALAGARKRELAAAWAWNRKDATVDLTPLVAATLALWGWQTSDQIPPGYDPLASIGASHRLSEG